MTDWHPLYTVVSGIPVALLTAWVAVVLALRRYKSEKWFERRIDAYTRIIESLHHMKETTQRQLRAAERGVEIPSDAEKDLIDSYRKSSADLRRLTDMGALVFSAEAVEILERLNGEREEAMQEQSWWEHLDAEAAAINKCLREIRFIAKRDLQA